MSSTMAPEAPAQFETVEKPVAEQNSSQDIQTNIAEFAELQEAAGDSQASSLDSLLDVIVTVTAELGRSTLSIADVLKLAPGSVLQLDRQLAQPVDLMVRGVRIARGEVVVVDDHFAIRIKEIPDPKKNKSRK